MSHTLHAVLLFLVFAVPASAADSVKLRTLTGKTVEGELESITEKEVVVRTKTDKIVTPSTEVLDIEINATATPTANKYTDIELTDGSLLHVTKVAVKKDNVELTLVGGPEVKIPLSKISYLLNEAHDVKVREEWQHMIAKRGNQDLLAVKDPAGNVNPLPGTFGAGDDTGETIEFEPAGAAKRPLKLARAHAISFWRKPDPESPAVACRVHDAAKSMLAATKIVLDDRGYHVTTASGIQVDYPLTMLTRIDYSQGKLAYLSDLQPTVVERSELEWVDHYRRDRGLDGGPLRLAKENYAKGLALHAYTELVYDIGGQYKEFKSIIGVDPKVGGDSDVTVTIEGDGRPLFNAQVTRKMEPIPVTLDVKTVRLLRIVIRSNRLLGLGDHVNLGDAKVSK